MKKLVIAFLLTALAAKAYPAAQDLNQPLTLIATVKVKPGFEKKFKEVAVQILKPTRAEQGNLSYAFHQSPIDPTEFATVEIWKTQLDIDEHMALPHMKNFFQQVGGMFAPAFPVIKTYQKFKE